MTECVRTCIESGGLVGFAIAVAIVLGPSVVVALTRYPRARGAVRGLLVALDLLSVLTHRDSPGTAKIPGRRSVAPAATSGPA